VKLQSCAKNVVALGLTVATTVGESLAQICDVQQIQKIGAADSNPTFGFDIAMHENLAVVGNFAGGIGGRVYLYEFIDDVWTEVQILTAFDALSGDSFGRCVAVSQSWMVVGAPNDDHPGPSGTIADGGSVYVFKFVDGDWMFDAKLIADAPISEDVFGSSVSVDGDAILIGAPGNDSASLNCGVAYVFRHDGKQWVQEQKVLAESPNSADAFGATVRIQGNTAFIGTATPTLGPSLSSINIFTFDGNSWIAQQQLLSPSGLDTDHFGRSIAFDGDTLLIGAPESSPNGVAQEGSAYLYELRRGQFELVEKLTSVDGAAGDRFGYALGIDGDAMIITAPFDDVPNGSGFVNNAGSAQVFYRQGSTWVFHHRIRPNPGPDFNGQPTWQNKKVGTVCAMHQNAALLSAISGLTPASIVFFETYPLDCDGNGVPDACDLDCNVNQVNDACEIAAKLTSDCDGDAIPDVCQAQVAYANDDGVFNSVYGAGQFSQGFDMIWLNRFDVKPSSQTVTHIGVAWSWTTPDDAVAKVLVYSDPNGDGSPSDAVLLYSETVPTNNLHGEFALPFTIYPITRTAVGDIGEIFFVGVAMSLQPSQLAAVLDTMPAKSFHGLTMTTPLGTFDEKTLPTSFTTWAGAWAIRALSLDCNGNGTWDQCDIDTGFSADVNANGLPDECEGSCVADLAPLKGNAVVDVDDLLFVINNWGVCEAGEPCQADVAPVGGNGIVDVDDLLFIINNWGPCL
jgi:hypothetical protein